MTAARIPGRWWLFMVLVGAAACRAVADPPIDFPPGAPGSGDPGSAPSGPGMGRPPVNVPPPADPSMSPPAQPPAASPAPPAPAPAPPMPGTMKPPAGAPPGMPPGACGARTVPANVQQLLATRCQLCHGNPPLGPVPGSLVSAEDFLRPAKTDPARNTGDVVLTRIAANGPTRMPPPPAEPLTAAETDTLRLWLATGLPANACPQPPGPGTPPGAGVPPSPRPNPLPGPDPFAVPARCTSGRSLAGEPSPVMNPGEACIDCHSRRREGGGGGGDDGPLDPTLLDGDGEHGGHGGGEGGGHGEGGEGHGGREGGEGGEGGGDEGGPRFAFAGTVYPSPHEPNRCWGVSGGAQIVVMDASGRTFSAPVNAAGNYYMGGQTLTPPLRAKVTFMGRERIMIGSVPHGDCNLCHTQSGNTTIAGGTRAPGRIVLP